MDLRMKEIILIDNIDVLEIHFFGIAFKK